MPTEAPIQKAFGAHVLIKHAEEKDGKWIVSGPIHDLAEDYDGETMEKSGILNGMKVHARLGGHVDYEHLYKRTHDPKVVIGKRLDVSEEDGKPWLTTELYKTKPLAKSFWDHIQAGGEAGYSIEGVATKRDPKNAKHILDTEIHMVTLTLSPKSFGSRVHAGAAPSLGAIAKALSDGGELAGLDTDWNPAEDIEEIEAQTVTTGATKTHSKTVSGATVEKAALRHASYKCPKCGKGMYCIHCHRAESVKKSAGSGDVEPTKMVTKAEADYTEQAEKRHCCNCDMYRDGKCTLVKGHIDAHGSCKYFEAKKRLVKTVDLEKSKMHPGFDRASANIAKHEGVSEEAADAILAASSRDASKKAKKKNPRLNRVGGTSKAMTTGGGIVLAGMGAPGDASPLREQSLLGANAVKKKKRAKKREAVEKAIAVSEHPVVERLTGRGLPQALAEDLVSRLVIGATSR